jgi:hypothetical protein
LFRWLHSHPDWPTVREILEASGVLVLDRSENKRAPRDRLHATVKISELIAALGGEQPSDDRIADAVTRLEAEFPPPRD